MTVFAGADVGGTSTRVVIERDGAVVGRATGRLASIRPGRAMASAAPIAETVRKALVGTGVLHADVLVVGAAGVGRETERGELERALRLERVAERVIVTTDVDIARVAAFGDAPGVVLVSGTGSIVLGRLPDGSEVRRGGLGWQMGDEGSGYWIGRAALYAVGRAEERRGRSTLLQASVRTTSRNTTFDDLIRWSLTAGSSEVAALAPAVLAAAAANDRVAGTILDDAAGALTNLARSLIEVYPGEDRVPVALTGGLLESTDLGLDALRARVLVALADVKRAEVRPEPVESVLGALWIARRDSA